MTTQQNQQLIKALGLRISTIRNVQGMSRSRLSRLAEISMEDLRDYEKGFRPIQIDQLERISGVLKVKIFQFFL